MEQVEESEIGGDAAPIRTGSADASAAENVPVSQVQGQPASQTLVAGSVPVPEILTHLSLYNLLMALEEDSNLVSNSEAFECSVCLSLVDPQQGVVLRNCLHLFCRECLSRAAEFSEEAMIKCPFRNDDYSCESHLLQREIEALVTPSVFEKHLQRSMKIAESQAKNSFHCKTVDCRGWFMFEGSVTVFACPVCSKVNCLTCDAIHEGKNCTMYRDETQGEQGAIAGMSKEYIDSMISRGEAMRCPTCTVLIKKELGCDGVICTMCRADICWITKGPRWGPAGRGDTSGGCRCKVNFLRCHPQCSGCH